MELNPGRRVQLTLGGGGSISRYRAVVLDAQLESVPFLYHCAVFIVPKVSHTILTTANIFHKKTLLKNLLLHLNFQL